MHRREFLYLGPLALSLSRCRSGEPPTAPLQPIPEPHFPNRVFQLVWRNWELANTSRIARVLRTSEDNVLALGASMGLPPKRLLSPDQLRRLHITVIRQNWHLLPLQQLIQLLGWDRPKFEFTLKEDDFLDIKLGPKPDCGEVLYRSPSSEELHRAGRMREILQERLGSRLQEPGQEPFHFVRELSRPGRPRLRDAARRASRDEVDLSSGWSLIQPAQPRLAQAARRFQDYLHDSMEAQVALTPGPPSRGKTIRLAVSPSGAGGGRGFRVQVGSRELRVTGQEEGAVLQGLYWLQDQMELRSGPFLPRGTLRRESAWDPRYLYSYLALFGDPLLEDDIDPFPGAYLEALARAGINGVWMHSLLSTLAPSPEFPEFGKDWEKRLRRLNSLVEHALGFGIRIYLYLNEPRAMPASFFDRHPDIKGSPYRRFHAMCTSVPRVRRWIANSLTHVMRQVPDLGGWFSITMSENHTNCFSHGSSWGREAPRAEGCPRCSQRESWEVIGELIGTFREGVRRASSTAEVIAWDWGWGDDLSANLIPLLPKDVRFMSISEWEQPVSRGGVETQVGEYSISVVGPGPRARRNWARADREGIRTMAKLQFNNTWEISAVPYIPVVDLILQHCEKLSKTGISGIMPSWTCGGYASPNLEAAKAYYFRPAGANRDILLELATRRYGPAAAPLMVEAWRQFSQAFQEFPYGVRIYNIPTQHGPANPLRLHPTGYRSSMMLFPQDDYRTWSGAYPPEVVAQQFRKLAAGWRQGLQRFRQGAEKVSPTRKDFAAMDLAIAQTCQHHFQSTANQVEFYLLREKLRQSQGEEPQAAKRMIEIAQAEIELARAQFSIARHHSTIAFEASNHYYYRPLDLAEKILNCRQVIDVLSRAGRQRVGGTESAG